jgi:hypothetical protein
MNATSADSRPARVADPLEAGQLRRSGDDTMLAGVILTATNLT